MNFMDTLHMLTDFYIIYHIQYNVVLVVYYLVNITLLTYNSVMNIFLLVNHNVFSNSI